MPIIQAWPLLSLLTADPQLPPMLPAPCDLTSLCRCCCPPAALQPRTAMRSNYSHSQQRVRQILRDNEALVRRLG